MMYKKSAPPDTELTIARYQFIKPIRLKICTTDGVIQWMGYGVGEIVEVLEPKIQNLCCNHELLDRIPLADGSYIIDVPNDLDGYVKYYR